MRRLYLILALALATRATAQSGLPPIQKLPTPSAVSPRDYKLVPFVRTLRNGTLFVNDQNSLRVSLVDTTFKLIKVIADTLRDTPVQYGLRTVSLMPYLGDSTLLVETMTPEMYVLDAAGNIGRRMAVPSPRDAAWLAQSPLAEWASTDATGRLLYRTASPRPAPTPTPKPGEMIAVSFPDSAPIMRADLVTRNVETFAWYKIRKLKTMRVANPGGPTMNYPVSNPTASSDSFVILSDGTLAIVKGDYHIDVVTPDGKITSSARIPYPWHRLSDADKAAIMDSIRKASDARRAAPPPATTTSGGGSGSGGGISGMDQGASRPAPDVLFAKPEDLADYLPAFTIAAVYADARGNIWIKTRQPSPIAGTSVFDVVTREGKVLSRFAVPDDRAIVGFDASSVYLSGREGGAAWLERVRIP